MNWIIQNAKTALIAFLIIFSVTTISLCGDTPLGADDRVASSDCVSNIFGKNASCGPEKLPPPQKSVAVLPWHPEFKHQTLNSDYRQISYEIDVRGVGSTRLELLSDGPACNNANLRLFYEGNLVIRQPVDSRNYDVNQGDGIYNSNNIDMPLADGTYILNIDLNPGDGGWCSVITTAQKVGIPSSKEDDEILKRGQLIPLAEIQMKTIWSRATIQGLSEYIDLSSLSIRITKTWDFTSLERFLSTYCPTEEEILSESKNEGYFGRGRDEEKEEQIALTKLFENNIDKMIYLHDPKQQPKSRFVEDFMGGAVADHHGLNVNRIICSPLGARWFPWLDPQTILSFLNSNKALRYRVTFDTVNAKYTARSDKTKSDDFQSDHILISLLSLIAETADATVGQISFNSGGQCTSDSWLISFSQQQIYDDFASCPASAEVSDLISADRVFTNVSDKLAHLPTGKALLDAVLGVVPKAARADVMDQFDDSVRVRVSAIKGWINPANPRWERVWLTAMVGMTEKGIRMHLMLDGVVASGAGSYEPPADAFVKSMDTVPGYNLSESAKILFNKINSSLASFN